MLEFTSFISDGQLLSTAGLVVCGLAILIASVTLIAIVKE